MMNIYQFFLCPGRPPAGQWKRMVGFFRFVEKSPFEIIDLILLRIIQFGGRLDDFEK